MQIQRNFSAVVCILAFTTLLIGCAGMGTQPTPQNLQPPTVTLDHAEVANYFGWWFYADKVKPTLGKPGKNGAPLDLAFVFNIANTNAYPVMLEGLKFSVAFEDFTLNTVSSDETQWIPAGKTNQVRVHALFDVNPALSSLLVTGGFKMQAMGLGSGPGAGLKLLEKWWTGAPEFAFPIQVKEGAAVFKADGVVKVGAFEAVFP
jgi:hypothetical protein